MPSGKRDIFAEWFVALEELGESFAVNLARFAPGMSAPEWYHLPHQQYDGIGGLAHVLRTERHTDIEVPFIKEKRPSSFRLFATLLRSLFRNRTRSVRFRFPIDEEWGPAQSDGLLLGAAAWLFFSRKETKDFRKAAKLRGIPLNVWLFWSLKEALRPDLAPAPGRPMEWVFPLSMRGAIPSERDTDNAAFSVEIAFPQDATPEAMNGTIQAELARGAAWLGPWLMGLMRFMSPKALKRAVQKGAQIYKIGSYTNLGARGPKSDPPDASYEGEPEEWWMAFGSVLKRQPVGMVCITWRGCMSVTLRLHPAMQQDRARAETWLARWKEIALAPLASGAGALAALPTGSPPVPLP